MRIIKLLSLCCLLIATQIKGQIINTIAGTGTTGYAGDGGPALNSRLNKPQGIAVDKFGNVYIADTENDRIRKINAADSSIITIAGNGTAGFGGDNSAATSANINKPSAVAVDSSGNIYIADSYNNRIRKVDALSHTITTIAGNDNADYTGDGGMATASSLNNPTDVALDNAGNIFIADQNNACIRKINAATSIITTVAGNGTPGNTGDGGPAVNALLGTPSSICIDKFGNLFIGDQGNYTIRKVDAATQVITKIAGTYNTSGSADNVLAENSTLTMPYAMASDSMGNLYFADFFNHAIRKITFSTGMINTVAGQCGIINFGFEGDGFAATLAKLAFPMGVAVDGNYNIYIADTYNERIRKVSSPCKTYTFLGSGNWSDTFNWQNGEVPPSTLPSCCEIIIDNWPNDNCILDIPQTIANGARITVKTKSHLIIPFEIATH